MEIILSPTLYYDTKVPPSLGDVGASLQALERIAKRAPAVLERLFDGLSVSDISAHVERIENGSLSDQILLKITAQVQQSIQRRIEGIGEKLGIEKLKANSELMSWVILLLIIVGGTLAVQMFTPNPSAGTHIEGDRNVILTIGQDMTGYTPEELADFVNQSVRDKKQLARDAVEVLAPARADPNTSLSNGRGGNIRISPESIREIPRHLAPDEEEETLLDLSRADIFIRATDMDSGKKGWGVVIPEIHPERRITMHVTPGIDLVKLARHERVVGDVTVLMKPDGKGGTRPFRVILHELYTEDEPEAGS